MTEYQQALLERIAKALESIAAELCEMNDKRPVQQIGKETIREIFHE